LTDDQHFEFGEANVEAAQDKAILEVFISVVFTWLSDTFPELLGRVRSTSENCEMAFQQTDECRRCEKKAGKARPVEWRSRLGI